MHIDAEGFATWVRVMTGRKLWVVAVPRSRNVEEFANIQKMVDFHQEDGVESDEWELEAVHLQAGDQLLVFIYFLFHCYNILLIGSCDPTALTPS